MKTTIKNAIRIKRIVFTDFRKSMILILIFFLSLQIKAETIYVSPNGNDNNDGNSPNTAIRTLTRAKELCENSRDNSFTILLEGGVTHDEFETDFVKIYNDSDPEQFAFVWDIDKELTISTYGSTRFARLDGAQYDYSDGEPTVAICIIEPSSKKVVIENLFIENFQEGTIRTHDTENVTIRNIDVNNIGTRFHPDPNNSADPGADGYPYVAGVIYPKNSNNVLIENIVMTNCHNIFVDSDGLHGFYATRLSNSTIRNVYMRNVSGSPIKTARRAANNITFSEFKCYWTGTTNTHGSDELVQPGFYRLSSKSGDGCPTNNVIENSTFWYPYCWSEYEDCGKADGQICSVTSPSECGGRGYEVCDGRRPEVVAWNNVDLRTYYTTDETGVPPIPNMSGWRAPVASDDRPTDLIAKTSVNAPKSSIDLNWTDNDDDENGFEIERSTGNGFSLVATVGANVVSYTDKQLDSITTYTYRVRGIETEGTTGYSNEASASTTGVTVNDLPWVEDFTLTNGTIKDSGATSWETEYSGSGEFSVQSNRFSVSNTDDEAIWTSENINIQGSAVEISLDVEGTGGLDSSGDGKDWLRIYYSIDGSPERIIKDFVGLLSPQTVTASNIAGNSLTIIIKANNTAAAENYYVDNISVTATGNGSTGQDSASFEAENGVIASPMQIISDSNASNGQYVTVRTGNNAYDQAPVDGKVTFIANLNKGSYKLWGKVRTPSETDDSFWVQIDNGAVYRWNKISGGVNDFVWTLVHDTDNNNTQVTWDLESGEHIISFYYREDGTQLDQIYITNLDDTPGDNLQSFTRRLDVSTFNAKITAYPNPSKDGNVQIGFLGLKNITVSAYNLSGLLVRSKTNLDDKTSLNLPKGIYILKIQNERITQTKQLVVQ
ncbi:T9SS type A sorting domain-containing protein [Aquimarina sp. U1-2]|uniref:T9SS type A sorting domain-containing protein n=1 Tax=Aquimarina sp. U1-2 TaxID=2823141 RepID=UPI001AEC9CE4|nr:T9SS type A sorting domain-containing protein [Aquimarina sp. U1-2]MBP2831647.1 T9SS type A sorting domain-containing protein [Aquimarina sp. U1-2]